MNETEMKQKIVDYINSMGIDEKIALHNTYCDAINFEEDHIYAMDDMQKVLYGMDTWTLVDMMWRGRSEERRVGKERRSRWSPYQDRKSTRLNSSHS